MHKLIVLAAIISTPLFAAEKPRVIETTRYQDGLISIEVQSEATAKSGGLFSGTRSKLKATKAAKELGEKTLNSICTNGHMEGTRSHGEAECDVLDSGENKMKCAVTTKAICKHFPGLKSAAGLNMKLGHLQPSAACVEVVNEQFSIDDAVVENCNKIKNELQFECVELISKYNTIKTYAIGECSKFKNQHPLNVLRQYTGESTNDGTYFAAPTVDIISTLSQVQTEEQETCVKNLMALDRISSRSIKKECLKKSDSIGDRIWNFFN
ncbi:MAG: hypothetical protein KC478_14225 [Bacteriovoracaceae bacterium]|nr:hypothetical protein [Bacteriovoracaceae bacterium]